MIRHPARSAAVHVGTDEEPIVATLDKGKPPESERWSRVIVRRADRSDQEAIVAMGRRCSRQVLAQRFHAYVHAFPCAFVDSVVGNADDRINLVAVSMPLRQIVGIGMWCQTSPRSGELGLLVEDAYQRQRIGSRMLNGLVEAAIAKGSPTFEAVVLREHVEAALRLAGPTASHLNLEPHGDVTGIWVTIDPTHPPK